MDLQVHLRQHLLQCNAAHLLCMVEAELTMLHCHCNQGGTVHWHLQPDAALSKLMPNLHGHRMVKKVRQECWLPVEHPDDAR